MCAKQIERQGGFNMKKPQLSELTLREKIGQLGNYISSNCLKMIQENHKDVPLIGSIWGSRTLNMDVIRMVGESEAGQIYSSEQREFMKEFNKNAKIPAIAAMDCIRGIQYLFKDLSRLMCAPTIGATNSEDIAYRTGVAKAKEFKCAGAQWVWGPEEDISSRYKSISLGRLYSDDPELITKLGIAESKGIQDNGVAATAKHFPGDDGKEYRDAHTSISTLHLSMEEWEKGQGKVFRDLIDAGVYSVMISHLAFPACDNTMANGHYIPSTISHKVVTGLLKEKLGFKGVVITDAIGMHSLADLFDGDMIEICIACINAGCDVMLSCPIDFIDGIEQAVLNGRIAESRIDDACQRVLDMKEKLGVFDGPIEEMDVQAVVAESNALKEETARKSLSLVCDKKNILPLDKEKYKNVAIIFSGFGGVFESLGFMEDELKKHGVQNVTIVNGIHSLAEAEKLSGENDLMLYVSHISFNQPFGIAGYQGDDYQTFSYIDKGNQKGKRIGVSLGSPYVYFDYYSDFDCFINAYNPTEETQRALIKAFYGELSFEGIHPFRLIPEGF